MSRAIKKIVVIVARGNRGEKARPPRITIATAATILLSSCSLAPDLKMPELYLPSVFKEQSKEQTKSADAQGIWKPAAAMEKEDRGAWWKIFGDSKLNELEKQAVDANQSLKEAAARVEQSRAMASTNKLSFLPDVSIGANAVRSQPSSASLAAFGGLPGAKLKPYTLYTGQGVASYEADIFGRVRDTYKSYLFDSDAQEATYRDVLLALQADVAQTYFSLRSLDAQRILLRDAVTIREEEARITDHQFNVGEIGEQDRSRAQADLASVKADLLALEQERAQAEHALAVLLGKIPSEYNFAEVAQDGLPPEIPAGLPSPLLERRPDVVSAQSAMAAANARIGVARTAFFPQLILTASGGFQSTSVSDLFQWSNRTWALGQIANTALTMPIFDSGRNMARLDYAHAAYDEAVATYRQQVLVAFRDVEDNLSAQRFLAGQSQEQDIAATASQRMADLMEKRYHEGDVAYTILADAQRDALTARRAATQIRGQRFLATVGLIRALGGGWDGMITEIKPPVIPPVVNVQPTDNKQ